MPTTLAHPLLHVEKIGKSVRTRKIYQVGGWSPPIEFGVHNASINNLQRAILERVYYVKGVGGFVPTPKPCEGIFKERLGYFSSQLVRYIGHVTPMGLQDFPTMYQGRKRTIYQNAVDSLLVRSVERRDSYLKAFVKAEKINFTAKGDPAPRVIQPRDPRYNAEVGVYLKPLEPKIYQAVARLFGEITIFKGLNAQSSGHHLYRKWCRYREPVAIGLDASRFDQHVSPEALRWEHSFYLRCFKGKAKLAKLLEWQIANRGYGYCSDGKLKYSVTGCRMSGDMNTALGNCLIMCALVHSYCKSRGVDRFSLANNGDDCVVIMEKSDLACFQEGLITWFLEMGFNMKVETPVFIFEQIEFCQCKPIHVDNTSNGPDYIMCRSAPVALAKDCMSIIPLDSRKGYEKQMSAIGDCGLALTGGIPIFQSFYCGMLRAGRGRFGKVNQTQRDNVGKEIMRIGMNRNVQAIQPYTRFSFWLAFGITPEQQFALEEYYDLHTPYWRDPVPLDRPSVLPDWFGS
jgi:hypothetical protein